MKKTLLMAAAVVMLFSACQKEAGESLGNIPGMGDAGGNLEVEAPYVLPQGVEIVGTITGAPEGDLKAASTTACYSSIYGSGGKDVKVQITIENKNDKNKTVYFPKGLVWQCGQEGAQNAITAQTSWICVNAHSKVTFVLQLYCINHGKRGSSENSSYWIVGVTSSEIIKNFLKTIGNKGINYEMFVGLGLKSAKTDVPAYEEVVSQVQGMIWKLTNYGEAITAEDEAFLARIPDIDEAQFPTEEDINLSNYFPEFLEIVYSNVAE